MIQLYSSNSTIVNYHFNIKKLFLILLKSDTGAYFAWQAVFFVIPQYSADFFQPGFFIFRPFPFVRFLFVLISKIIVFLSANKKRHP